MVVRLPRVDAADGLARLLEAHGVPKPEREYRFHPVRRWRFDLAWPAFLLALEVEGGGYVAGRHATGKGIEDDCEKLSEAVALGWAVMRVTPRQFERADPALSWIRAALALRRVFCLCGHGEHAAYQCAYRFDTGRCDCEGPRWLNAGRHRV